MQDFHEDSVGAFWVDPKVVGVGAGLFVVGDAGDSAAVGTDVSYGVANVVHLESDEVDTFASGFKELADGTALAEGLDELDEGFGAVAEVGAAVAELGVVVGHLHNLKTEEVAESVGGFLKVVDGDAYEAQVCCHALLPLDQGAGPWRSLLVV